MSAKLEKFQNDRWFSWIVPSALFMDSSVPGVKTQPSQEHSSTSQVVSLLKKIDSRGSLPFPEFAVETLGEY